MVYYNFKTIRTVPCEMSIIDSIISGTQRQNPTDVQNNYDEKLSIIIKEFPLFDDIHPLYGDLLHFLFNKDHYKLALVRINAAQNLIRAISEDYVRTLKYGDSLNHNTLKDAALGRMCTVVQIIGPSLAYLEQIRQHMARLPCIVPTTRTILICGLPNVGKSSFMNKITRADVDVQPYAFTTKSLFVGHTEYKHFRYQVIDTPGISDEPIGDRDITNMCSMTALIHLKASVLFFLDISGSCGYTIAQQAALFHNLKHLFMNKPLMIVCNKSDMQSLEGISEEDKKLVAEMEAEAKKTVSGQGGEAGNDKKVLFTMSTLTEEGVIAVKNTACERLLDQRVEVSTESNKINDCLHRLHAAMSRTDQDQHGHNVYDFVDPDILQRLEELELQEGIEFETMRG